MHDITLKYMVKRWAFPYFKLRYPFIKLKEVEKVVDLKVASNWNELSAAQLLKLIRIQFTFEPGHLQKLHLLQTMLQVKWVIIHLLTGVQKIGLYKLLDFLEDNTLTKQLLPFVKVKRKKLYGPLERFRNLTFAEFIYVDTLFSFYMKYQKEIYLDKLISCLYRPKREDYNPNNPSYKGDIREDFNEHLIDNRLPLIQKFPPHIKMAILAWYRGCRKELEATYDKVFTEENQQKAAKGDWGDVLLVMSGDKLGPLEQTSQQRVHMVFKEMQRKARENEEAERNNRSN